MVNEKPEFSVACRVESDGHIATVKYIGEVPPTQGEWLGVEWDDPKRGKHDGSHEGVRYFQTSDPKSGSFIRPKKANPGVTFWIAAQDRYGEIEDESAGVETEEMFVCGKNSQQTVVEIVGAKKVNKQQSKFDQLREIGLRAKGISRAGNVEAIQENFPRVIELDISANLLCNWDAIASICRALPKLQILNVSENHLQCPENADELKDAFKNVKTLFMNHMKYTWEDIKTVLVMFEQLETIHLCWNNITTVDTLCPNLTNLVFLNLTSNPITSWQDALVFGELKRLAVVLFNDCGLSELEFPDVPHGEKTALFPSLKELAIAHNKYDKWSIFDQMNKLQSLTNLRVQKNPIAEPNDTHTEATIRSLIMAKIEKLELLNRTVVDPVERKGAEIDYRKTFGLLWKEHGGNQDPAQNKPNDTFTSQHPRYQALIDKYGAPEDSELKIQSGALKDLLIVVKISCPNLPYQTTIKKKLPMSMTVQKLKMLSMRLLKLDPQTDIRLTYATDKMPDKEVELENDQKDIGYYSIEDGDTLFVRFL